MEPHLLSHWFGLIAPLFPVTAQFDVPRSGAANSVSISWNLESDQNRPNKRSKTINVVFAAEAVDVYLAGTDAIKSGMDNRLLHHIATRIAQFNPNHAVAAGQYPPNETWLITAEILIG